MNPLNRKTFLRKLLLAGLGSAFLPRWARSQLSASQFSTSQLSTSQLNSTFAPNDYGVIDLHCHPSLKMYLWGRKLWRHHTAGLGINATNLQDDMDQMSTGSIPFQDGEGFVKGIVVAHYLPEEAVKEQWDKLKKLYPWIERLFSRFAGKLEHGDFSNFTQINRIIDQFEDQVKTTMTKKRHVPFVIATSFKKFQDAINQNQFPIAHAIEGAHALGRNTSASIDHRRKHKPQPGQMMLAGENDAQKYLDNLQILKDRGVCMMTLAHLFPNDITACVEGISYDEKQSIGMEWYYSPDKDTPLTPVGEKVVEWMLDNGMIIDLTHSTPATRARVFAINAGKPKPKQRPIVFTHTGARKIFNDHDAGRFPYYGYYCVSDEEVASIVACNGTIGIIPEVFWLAGGDTHLREQGLPPKLYRNGIPYMVETIQYINSLTPNKDYNHISIGTDFDGLADAPQDLYEASQLDSLIEALRAAKIPDDAVKRIMWGNALRVLHDGWT